jgi:membrane-bound inhibitor of C-type lysozyme
MKYEYKRDVNWKKDLEIGSKQESKFEVFMKSFGYVVEDVSKVKEYQDKSIDYVCSKNNISKTFEIKQDKTLSKFGYDRRRLCIEDISSIKDKYGNVVNTNGWYRKCKADYLIIGNSENEMFMYRFDDLKEYIDLFSGDDSIIHYYQLGNSMIHGVYQQKFDKWLIDNNKVCKVFYLDSNKCKCRKDVK